MALYAISDLHLGSALGKTMDKFGKEWENHVEKIRTAWCACVREEDTVLMPGDLSWAMRWDAFQPDLDIVASLPGQKILSRGNHDYFWQSQTKLASLLPEGVCALNQTAMLCEGYAVAGVKGWLTPGSAHYDAAEDERLFLRERQRLIIALEEAKRLEAPIIVQMHFPPLSMPSGNGDTGFLDLLQAYEVKLCVYGHLHGGTWEGLTQGRSGNLVWQLVSCDYLGFAPLPLAPLLE